MQLRANLRRLLYILRVLVRHGAAYAVGRRLARWPAVARRYPLSTLGGPERFRRLLEDLGGSFIKFGQMLALQPDIISLEYCDELFNLMDRVAPFPFEQVEQVVREELGRAPHEIFDRFDPAPMATASIGQVHVAHLGERKLAVKVRRPLVDVEFSGDIRLMTLAIRLIRRWRVRALYWVIEPMSEFVGWTREELDYRKEARYMERLRLNARDNPTERVPGVLWEYVTRRTLVMEFVPGETVLDYLRALGSGDPWLPHKLRAGGFDPSRFARHIIDNFLGDAFRYGVFHADLHPANLLILPDDVVGYVDFGITGVLSRFSRRHLVAMTLAYTRADLDGMVDAFSKLTTSEPEADPARFREGLRELSEGWYEADGGQTRFKKNFTLVMLDMLTLSRKTGIWPERDVIKYIRSAIAVDGLITRFAPGFSVGRHLEAVCNRWVTWDARRALLSYDTVVGWMASSRNLLGDGATRAAHVLRRIAEGEMTGSVEIVSGPDTDRRLRRRALRLASLVLAFGALIAFSRGPATFGVNVFTAEAALAGSAILLLGRDLQKLTIGG